MNKRLLFLVLIAMAFGSLFAFPEAHAIIPFTASANLSFTAMTIHDARLYYYDQKSCTLVLDDLGIDDINLARKSLAQLSPKAKIVDICADNERIYLLDADAKCIYIFELGADGQAHKLAPINLQGAKDIKFKGLKQIAVNYLGYIYLLDVSGLYAFSQEGMFMKYIPLVSPISMSLGEDQNLRTLTVTKLDYRLQEYDLNLYPTSSEIIIREKPTELRILDIAVNRWGELQFLNSNKSLFINKHSAKGVLLPDTQAGFKSSRREMLSFQNPIRIKCGKWADYSLIAVLDTKHDCVQIFRDQNIAGLPDLVKPTFAARVSLKKTDFKALDVYGKDGDSFVIQQATPALKAFKRLSPTGSEEYSILQNKLKAKGVQGFDAINGFGNDIYILDSKACKIHVFNAQTGDYISSFGGKGKEENSFTKPISLAVDKEGIIYVLDYAQKKIARFKKSEGYSGSINYNFIRNHSLKNFTVAPQLIRVQGDSIFCLFADGSIFKIDKTSDKQTKLDLGSVKAKTFDFVQEGDLALIDVPTQKLRIYTGPKYGNKANYLSVGAGATFPHFEQIQNLRYDASKSRLAIMDSRAEGMRYLYFYASLGDAPLVRMGLDANGIITLKWDADSGITNWIIKKISDKDTFQDHVSVPEYKCERSSAELYSYTVRAIAADQRQSTESEKLTDYFSYANYLRQGKKYRDAIKAYEYAFARLQDERVKEQIVQTYEEMANEFIARSNFDQAQDALDEAVKIVALPRLIEKKCELYIIEKKYQKALELLNRVQPSFQDYDSLTAIYIRISFLAEKYDDMLNAVRIYRTRYSDKTELYEYEAEAYKRTGRLEDAIDIYISLNSKQPSLKTELDIAKLEIELKNFPEAVERLSRLPQQYAATPQDKVQFLLGMCQLGLEVYDRAQEYFTEAIRINPQDSEYYYYLALAYNKAGMAQEAKANFKKAYEMSPQNVQYGFAYAKILHEGLFSDAAVQVMRAINEHIGNDAAAADYYLLYARILQDLKQLPEAREAIIKARKYRPQDFDIEKLYSDIDTAYNAALVNRPPLEILDLEVDDIYPALDNYYRKNRIGSVKLKNNRDTAIENITINVKITGVGAEKEYSERIVPANGEKIIPLKGDFTDAIFDSAGRKEIRVTAKYYYQGEDKTVPGPQKTIEILPRGAMDWSKRRSLSCFVNPSERYTIYFMNNIIRPVYGSESGQMQFKTKNIFNAIKIYSFYSVNGFQYISDAITSSQKHTILDNVKFPTETISNKSGDCEDFLVLLAASLEAIGIPTALIDLPHIEHVMLAIDTQMSANEIRDSGLEPDTFIASKDTYWLPLETTLMGKEGFIQAWLYAKKMYDESQNSASPAALFPFSEAREIYPVSSFSRPYSGWEQSTSKDTQVDAIYRAEIKKLSNMSLENKLLHYSKTLIKYPDNITYRLIYARELWTLGKKTEAENQYLEVLKRDPENYIANLNLGNICAESSRAADARYYYDKALVKADARQKDQIYCNLCISEYNNLDTQRAKEYFNLISDKQLLQERDSIIYLYLINN